VTRTSGGPTAKTKAMAGGQLKLKAQAAGTFSTIIKGAHQRQGRARAAEGNQRKTQRQLTKHEATRRHAGVAGGGAAGDWALMRRRPRRTR